MGLQRRLDRRAANTALNEGGAAGRVDLQHPVEMAHVEADRARVAVADRRLDAADHRGAAAERNDRDPYAACPIEHGGDLAFALRQGDEIGRVGEVAVKRAHRLRKGLAVSVEEAFVRV